ncbi:U6 snRNA phosphodiesterase Usb1 [Boeremia exigua]|uniref:U6 snRNA phosphodiesterase Usb1 n=1 Tax=Boeremia exigua TaxID=749465 RepID=UPI001E8DD485|nr:U6 snRNA phosphodiesterase Usb1 [Boeremia exigua]KAH6637877.1 U6 snRNA phosphodiesterase Usb1 [Boeremia exigua]
MSLVQYSDSDSGADDAAVAAQKPKPQKSKPALKRKRSPSRDTDLPPLPAAFHDLYSTNARVSTSDNPNLHGGRKRAVPHVEGNWPSHVYLEWVPSQAESDGLHSLIQTITASITAENKKRSKPLPVPDIIPSLQSDLGAPLPLHVSLSRTLQIKTEDRDGFLAALDASLRRAAVPAFSPSFSGLKWVPNFERNRWFLILGIAKPPHDELNRLLAACNAAAQQSGFAALYAGGQGDGPMAPNPNSPTARSHEASTDRSENFHVSVAWNLSEPEAAWVDLVAGLSVDSVSSPDASFDVVKARVGNVVHNFDLSTRKTSLGKPGAGARRASLGLG